ncbi:MAG: HD domain-containing phosphohydrolase [bacterium]
MEPLYFVCLLIAASSFFLGAYVFFKNPKILTNIMWGLLTLSITVWAIGLAQLIASADTSQALFWDRIRYVGMILVPLFYLHFIFGLLEINKIKKKTLVLIYAIGALFLASNFTKFFRKDMLSKAQGVEFFLPTPGILYYVFVFSFFAAILYLHFVMFRAYTNPNVPSLKRSQIKYLFTGTIITFAGGSINFLIPLGLDVYPIGPYFIFVFLAMSSYAIIKYKLLDIETVIHRTVGYVMASSLIVISFAGIFVFAQRLLPRMLVYDPLMLGLLFLVFLFIFLPLRDKAQLFVDRLFYKEKYEYRRFFTDFSKKLGVLIRLEELLPTIVHVTADTMHIDKVSISLLDENINEFTIRESRGVINSSVKINAKHPFLEWLTSFGDLIEKEQIRIDPLYDEIRPYAIEVFTKFEGEICIPLIMEHRLIGIIVLNRKISGDIYTNDDLELLSTLGKQSAMSINNALSYHSLQVRTEQLEALSSAGQLIASSLNLKTILSTLLNQIRDVMEAEIISILLLDEKTQELEIATSHGLDPKVAESSRIRLGERISGWVALHNEHLYVKNIEMDPRFRRVSQEKYYTSSLISVPLSVKNKVIGVINVNNKKNKEIFTPYDLELLKGLASETAVAIENARLYEDLRNSYMNNLQSLAYALDAKDPYTQGHVFRVGDYATHMGERLGMDRDEIENLETAAHMHDIGKIGISDLILHKPGKLTEEEYKKIKEHPEISEQIVSPIGLPHDVLSFIRHHHERIDGKGYPDGLKGENIPVGARILGIADAYDAMRSNRPYRKALSEEKAKEELRKCSNTQFDKKITDVFLKYLEEVQL